MTDTARNLIQMTVASVASAGLGTLTLGAAVADYLAFESGDDGLTFTVTISETGAGKEVRTGCTYTHSGTTLTRGTLEKSTTGAAIAFSSAAIVSVTASAGWGTLVDYQLDRAYTHVRGDGTTTQTLSAGANTKIAAVLGSVVANPKAWWDTTNKQFLPTRAGLYLINAGAQIDSGSSTLQCSIFKNGAAVGSGDYGTSSSSQVAVVSTMVSFNGTTDYADLRVYTDGSGIVVGGGGFTNNFFIAAYLGG